jgi:Ca2+-binding RTX toxin-like protein
MLAWKPCRLCYPDAGVIERVGNDDDTITGGDFADNLFGDAGDDLINSGAGNDSIQGGDGTDVINTEDVDDSADDDTLDGDSGTDRQLAKSMTRLNRRVSAACFARITSF